MVTRQQKVYLNSNSHFFKFVLTFSSKVHFKKNKSIKNSFHVVGGDSLKLLPIVPNCEEQDSNELFWNISWLAGLKPLLKSCDENPRQMVLEVYVVASVLTLTCTPTCVVTKLARIQVAREVI